MDLSWKRNPKQIACTETLWLEMNYQEKQALLVDFQASVLHVSGKFKLEGHAYIQKNSLEKKGSECIAHRMCAVVV